MLSTRFHHLLNFSSLFYLGIILFSSSHTRTNGFSPAIPTHSFTLSRTLVLKRNIFLGVRRTGLDDTKSSLEITSFPPVKSLNEKEKISLRMALKKKISAAFAHLKSDDFGSRREFYVVPQFFLVFSILFGKLPFFAETFSILFGPVLFIVGLFVTGLAIKEMGDSFTAYPVPVSKEKGDGLIRSGIFSVVRHPVYAGNLCCFVGLSIMTGSATRLLLTAFYYLYVENKSRQEENELSELYDSFESYKEEVQGKFIPQRILNTLNPKPNITSVEAWQ